MQAVIYRGTNAAMLPPLRGAEDTLGVILKAGCAPETQCIRSFRQKGRQRAGPLPLAAPAPRMRTDAETWNPAMAAGALP